jgi:hypothetical protein
MVEDIKKKDAEKKVRAELKKESKLLNAPASPDDLSDGLKEKLAKWGITFGTAGKIFTGLGIASVVNEAKADYDKYREQGSGPLVSTLGAAAETVRDVAVEGGARAVSMLPSMIVGNSSPAGEGSDIPGTQMTSNEPTVPEETADAGTLPSDALRVMQEDANMDTTNLDPEAGFISQADIAANQQMGSPTSQGFVSKYGENDQDTLQINQ